MLPFRRKSLALQIKHVAYLENICFHVFVYQNKDISFKISFSVTTLVPYCILGWKSGHFPTFLGEMKKWHLMKAV